MRNLETQVGQLAKQMTEQQGGQFLAILRPIRKNSAKLSPFDVGSKLVLI